MSFKQFISDKALGATKSAQVSRCLLSSRAPNGPCLTRVKMIMRKRGHTFITLSGAEKRVATYFGSLICYLSRKSITSLLKHPQRREYAER